MSILSPVLYVAYLFEDPALVFAELIGTSP